MKRAHPRNMCKPRHVGHQQRCKLCRNSKSSSVVWDVVAVVDLLEFAHRGGLADGKRSDQVILDYWATLLNFETSELDSDPRILGGQEIVAGGFEILDRLGLGGTVDLDKEDVVVGEGGGFRRGEVQPTLRLVEPAVDRGRLGDGEGRPEVNGGWWLCGRREGRRALLERFWRGEVIRGRRLDRVGVVREQVLDLGRAGVEGRREDRADDESGKDGSAAAPAHRHRGVVASVLEQFVSSAHGQHQSSKPQSPTPIRYIANVVLAQGTQQRLDK